MNKFQNIRNRIKDINGVLTIDGDVDLSDQALTELPDLSNVITAVA
jgi:hypothetical protein